MILLRSGEVELFLFQNGSCFPEKERVPFSCHRLQWTGIHSGSDASGRHSERTNNSVYEDSRAASSLKAEQSKNVTEGFLP